MTTSAPPVAANAPADADTTVWFALGTDEALAKQGVDRAQGLAAAEVKSRLAKYGPNKFTSAKKVTRSMQRRRWGRLHSLNNMKK